MHQHQNVHIPSRDYRSISNRVPVDIVLASVGAGIARDRLQASCLFLTDERVLAARVYQKVYPRRGRPQRWLDVDPNA